AGGDLGRDLGGCGGGRGGVGRQGRAPPIVLLRLGATRRSTSPSRMAAEGGHTAASLGAWLPHLRREWGRWIAASSRRDGGVLSTKCKLRQAPTAVQGALVGRMARRHRLRLAAASPLGRRAVSRGDARGRFPQVDGDPRTDAR